MRRILVCVALLVSMSSFANECSTASIDNALVEIYNSFADRTNKIEVGGLISKFEHIPPNFLSGLEWYLANKKCPQFSGHSGRRHLKKLFRSEIEVTVVDERGIQFDTTRKRTTTEIVEIILNQ